jgi:hypothetical protein
MQYSFSPFFPGNKSPKLLIGYMYPGLNVWPLVSLLHVPFIVEYSWVRLPEKAILKELTRMQVCLLPTLSSSYCLEYWHDCRLQQPFSDHEMSLMMETMRQHWEWRNNKGIKILDGNGNINGWWSALVSLTLNLFYMREKCIWFWVSIILGFLLYVVIGTYAPKRQKSLSVMFTGISQGPGTYNSGNAADG